MSEPSRARSRPASTWFAIATSATPTASSTVTSPTSRSARRASQQAHALGRYFAATTVPQIYSSPLERARQTAEIIASYLDSVPITYTDDLIETRFGLYLQGVPPKQVPWRRPLWFVHMVVAGSAAATTSRWPASPRVCAGR